MTRQEAINIIEGLFPADADHPDTAEIGQRLLEQAKRDTGTWRAEPDPVIFRYLQLCEAEDNRQARR